eukprot:CAMPEP_0185562178 /NCGR_PEP_ID=MMETSP1381-20130426/60830_1 /TAXON_ID=298111 /ORGANISM="Pavlova sp., Strain CCMP459" /LENGTH=235 /DNA_ID=CAMNT_0028176003 /DNA_START=29 /DNA_END=736 /DNA_ORIENTATION=+
MTTMLLQFHNLGLCSAGPVLGCALIYGGAAQLIAGFQEFSLGNNFGYSAFVSYGSFWIAFGTILFLNASGIYTSDDQDIGCFLLVWGFYTFLLFVNSMRIHTAMAITFLLLTTGFFGLTAAHLGHPEMVVPSAWVLIFCALSAWYMMAAAILEQTFEEPVLPLGKPWISKDMARACLHGLHSHLAAHSLGINHTNAGRRTEQGQEDPERGLGALSHAASDPKRGKAAPPPATPSA